MILLHWLLIFGMFTSVSKSRSPKPCLWPNRWLYRKHLQARTARVAMGQQSSTTPYGKNWVKGASNAYGLLASTQSQCGTSRYLWIGQVGIEPQCGVLLLLRSLLNVWIASGQVECSKNPAAWQKYFCLGHWCVQLYTSLGFNACLTRGCSLIVLYLVPCKVS